MMPFRPSSGIKVSLSSSPSPSLPGSRSRSGAMKNLAVFKKAMTRKNSGWSSRGWQTRTDWQPSPNDDSASVLGKSGRSRHPGEVERGFSHGGRTGDAGKRQEGYLGQKLQGKLRKSMKKKRRKNSWSQCRNESSKWRWICGMKLKSTLLRGSRKEGDQIPYTRRFGKWYRAVIQKDRTWSTTLTRSRQKSKSWVGETVRDPPDAGLNNWKEEESSSKRPACLWGQAPRFEDRSMYLIAQPVGSSFRVLRREGEHHRFVRRLGHLSGLAQVACAFINSLVFLHDQV